MMILTVRVKRGASYLHYCSVLFIVMHVNIKLKRKIILQVATQVSVSISNNKCIAER